MISQGEINPLNVLKARELKYLPPHFSMVKLPAGFKTRHHHSLGRSRVSKIRSWIYENLEGRFYVADDASYDISELVVAFEKSSELSFFNLACPEVIV